MLVKLIFSWYLLTNVITVEIYPDNKKVYHIHSIETYHAYKPEVFNWIKTGEFVYDDTLDDKVIPFN
jgi:hypothetical protein